MKKEGIKSKANKKAYMQKLRQEAIGN